MLSKEFEKIAGDEIQTYLFDQTENDIPGLQLRHREMFGLPFGLIAEQLNARKKASSKLPFFYGTKGILYPPAINVEQCSSEATGNFKAEIISREIGKIEFKAADLTGGFGIDSLFLSKKAMLLDYLEPDFNLLNIAKHNHNLVGCGNIQYHQGNAEEFIDRCNVTYDLIYFDPSRRDLNSKKVFRLAECQPDIKDLLPQIFKFTEFILIKTSPLLDIQQGLNELTAVKKVMVVSVSNECKELLFLLQKGFTEEPVIETYNIDKFGDANQFLSFTFNEEKNTESDFGEPKTYLFEPNVSILKAGAFKFIGKKWGLQKLHVNTHFYTSNRLEENFPGRIFKIDQIAFNPKNFLEKKANVITRNYPLRADELRKKLKLSDGGERYVIGFSAQKKKYMVLATRLA
jgi:hypothetical protein